MADERIRLEVQERELQGSRNTRRLRKQGLVPGVLYGKGKPHSIAVPERELRRVLTGSHGLHAILDVVLAGQKTTHASILKDYQVHPVRGVVTHIDLQEVRLDQPIHAQVTVDLVGDSAGVREGGVVSHLLHEVNVEALPMEIPDRLEVDISDLGVGDSFRVGDLPPRDGVTMLDDPETVIATVTQPASQEQLDELLDEAAAEAGQQPTESAAGEPSEADADAAGDSGTAPG